MRRADREGKMEGIWNEERPFKGSYLEILRDRTHVNEEELAVS